jgi:hypothetical protein
LSAQKRRYLICRGNAVDGRGRRAHEQNRPMTKVFKKRSIFVFLWSILGRFWPVSRAGAEFAGFYSVRFSQKRLFLSRKIPLFGPKLLLPLARKLFILRIAV